MVVLAVAFDEAGPEVLRDIAAGLPQDRNRGRVQKSAPASGHKDQMDMEACNHMPSHPVFHLDMSQAKCDDANMECIRGHVYTLKPDPDQEVLLARTAGVVRLVYNLALEQRRIWGGRPYKGGPSRAFGSKGLSGELSELRRDVPWIGAVSQTAQNQALIDLDKAYANFFSGRAGYPRPRKRGREDSFRHVGREISIRKLNGKWSEIRIPKIGWVRYRDTRPLRAGADGRVDIRSATIRRRAGGTWEVSISHRFEIEAGQTLPGAVGVDRGARVANALSTGEMVHLPDTVRKREKVIRRAARVLSRKARGSRRHAKARRRLARLRARDARARGHMAHVLSRRLSREFGLVAIEDLRIRNMTTSARGTLEEPGTNVRQKAGLNRSILNVGWFMFETMLAYKLQEAGGLLVKVPARNSSRECARCGHEDANNRKNQAIFACTACGHEDNADINAAKVILGRALRGEVSTRQRWNTPLLDVEGKASAPVEASTHDITRGLDAVA